MLFTRQQNIQTALAEQFVEIIYLTPPNQLPDNL